MTRSQTLLLFLLTAMVGLCSYSITDLRGDDELRRPLDLPSGGAGGDEDEEDAPETITFYGSDYEGDCFCWALDRSGSMGWNGRWGVLQTELSSAILSLSSMADFGVLFWSSNVISWQEQSVKATTGNKAAANSWAMALTPDGWTCIAPGVVKALDINRTSQKHKKVVIVLSDGEPICNGTNNAAEALESINQANWDMQEISTIGVEVSGPGQTFLQQMAMANQGTYTDAN